MYELAQFDDGGIVTARNGTLEWIEDSKVESFQSESAFEDRLTELRNQS